MDSTTRSARVAGALYLLMTLTAPIGLMYVPGKLVVRGDATATAGNLLASESLFRLGIASELFSAVVMILLVLALHRLLERVDRHLAVLMVILALVQVPIAFLNAVNALGALVIVRGAGFLSVFDKPQRDALAMLFLRLHDHGIIVNEVFWGLWLFPLGLLVFRSAILPRILGVWLIINGFAYLVSSSTSLLLPQYGARVSRIVFPALLGEMALMLWLLIMGARPQPRDAPAV